MIDGYARTLTILAALGAGISGGVFFAFSTFVMKALGRLPDAEGMSAMNAINKAAPTPLFMLTLFGTAGVSIALSVVALRNLDQNWAPYLLIGSALYLVCVVVTIVYHVPRNDAARPGGRQESGRSPFVGAIPPAMDSVEPCAHRCRPERNYGVHPVAAGLAPHHAPLSTRGRVSVLAAVGSGRAGFGCAARARPTLRQPLERVRGYAWRDEGPRSKGFGGSGRSAVRGASRLDDIRADVAARPRPRRRRRNQPVRKAVGGRLVVDPPAMKVRPGFFGRALDRKADRPRACPRPPRTPCKESSIGVSGSGSGSRCQPSMEPMRSRAVNPIRRHSRAFDDAVAGDRDEVHGRPIEYRQQSEKPGEPRLRRSKEQQYRVGGVTLGHSGRPLLPIRCKALAGCQ